MALKQAIEIADLLDSPTVTGQQVGEVLTARGCADWEIKTVESQKGSTDFLRITVPGSEGKRAGGKVPTLGIIGRLGGIGARPAAIGLVSDADGAVTALGCALKLADITRISDQLPGDVIIVTHICPCAPIIPHDLVPFIGSPVNMAVINRYDVQPESDAILTVDTNRGNWLVNQRGVAITPTDNAGYILKISLDLLSTLSIVTGRPPVVLSITTQDITPYDNKLDHVNSIVEPATATDAPLAGVALTAEKTVPGCASGANQVVDVEMAIRSCLEVAEAIGNSRNSVYDP